MTGEWEPKCYVEYYTVGGNGWTGPERRIRRTMWMCDDHTSHMIGGPASTLHNHDTGKLISENYWLFNKEHRIDGPWLAYYHDNGKVLEEWALNGVKYKTFEEWLVATPLSLEEKITMKLSR